MPPFRGAPWRAAVAEESMLPALAPGDWLLLDPTPTHWPRRGAVVVVREPGSGILAVKRIAAGPGDTVRTGPGRRTLAGDEAWLLGDNRDRSVDSRRYGPVPLAALVGRVWLRYAPLDRIGLVGRPTRSRR
jgi:signal peptidase I